MNDQKPQETKTTERIIAIFADEIGFAFKALVIWAIASKDYHVFDAIMELIGNLVK